jgi:heme exporter protein A
VLNEFGLKGHEDTFTYSLSAGQKRRLALARLIIRHAKLWILDEPFTSLDERGKRNMEVAFHNHLKSGGMILMTSHERLRWETIVPLTIRL